MGEEIDLLFLDKDPRFLGLLESIARSNRWSFQSLSDESKIFSALDRVRYRVVVTETFVGSYSALQILEWVKSLPVSPEVIVVTFEETIDSAVTALKLGACDYIRKSGEDGIERIRTAIRHALDKYLLLNRLNAFQEEGGETGFESIIGRSGKMQVIFEMIRNLAASDTSVLIQGESGTGKELIAKAIHRNSARKDQPMVVINCAAMPETLLESELFGYTKGSFTGALGDKQGLFEVADGGSIFLDEVGDMPVATQVKLLRVLQDGEIRRLGDNKSRHVDVRILSATNRELIALIHEGKFREDLFYRLNVISITAPPLRDRSEDIPLLAYHFLSRLGRKMGRETAKISVDALQALQSYAWPGNVRELENIIERAVVLSGSNMVTAKNLPPKILSQSYYKTSSEKEDLSELTYKEAKKRALKIFNRSYIIDLLKKSDGNITAAAEKAGMDRSNFKKIVRRYRIDTKFTS